MEEFVFCVDSDGCAMDTMTYKHQLFFGPIAADIFRILNRESFLKEWDRINLYSRTRGVNRFVGLMMGLEYAGVSDSDSLTKWVQETSSLSNVSLEKQLVNTPSKILQKTLEWSNEVNQQIAAYPGDVRAFSGVLEGLEKLHQMGKVIVVSSANKEAVQKEWSDQHLMMHVEELYCQESGKKEDIIEHLIDKGYHKDRILMIGDSPGDLSAAEQNQVSFFPILVGKESESWEILKNDVSKAFVSGELSNSQLVTLKEMFWANLD